jgi:DnaK suppressor protein
MWTILKKKMDKKRIETFRKRLKQEQRAILRSIRRGRVEQEAVQIGPSPDEADVAVDTYQKELELALQNSETNRLKAVTDALHRIEIGQWGLCANCEGPIPETRLNAVPWGDDVSTLPDRIEKHYFKIG